MGMDKFGPDNMCKKCSILHKDHHAYHGLHSCRHFLYKITITSLHIFVTWCYNHDKNARGRENFSTELCAHALRTHLYTSGFLLFLHACTYLQACWHTKAYRKNVHA